MSEGEGVYRPQHDADEAQAHVALDERVAVAGGVGAVEHADVEEPHEGQAGDTQPEQQLADPHLSRHVLAMGIGT